MLSRSPQYRDKLIKPPYQSLHILHFFHEYPITVHSYHANIPVMISPYDWTWTLGFPHVFRMSSLPRPASPAEVAIFSAMIFQARPGAGLLLMVLDGD